MTISEYSILHNLNKYHINKLCRRVIHQLKRLKGDNLLSGDDSEQKNVWEEICVQLQDEESFFWDVYDETVEQIINFIFKKVDTEILKFLSIMNDDKFEITEEGDFKYEDYNYCIDFACDVVKQEVYNQASMFTNMNIKRYLDKNTF